MTDCLDCIHWQKAQGEHAKCFDCAVRAVEEAFAERRAELKAVKPKAKPKPIAHKPVRRAVKPRPKSS